MEQGLHEDRIMLHSSSGTLLVVTLSAEFVRYVVAVQRHAWRIFNIVQEKGIRTTEKKERERNLVVCPCLSVCVYTSFVLGFGLHTSQICNVWKIVREYDVTLGNDILGTRTPLHTSTRIWGGAFHGEQRKDTQPSRVLSWNTEHGRDGYS